MHEYLHNILMQFMLFTIQINTYYKLYNYYGKKLYLKNSD